MEFNIIFFVVKFSLHDSFSMSGLILSHYFLGLEIMQFDLGFKMELFEYVLDLLIRFEMTDCKYGATTSLSRTNLEDGGTTPL